MGHIKVYVGSSVDYTDLSLNIGEFYLHLHMWSFWQTLGLWDKFKIISTTPMAVISVSDYQMIGYVKPF